LRKTAWFDVLSVKIRLTSKTKKV